MAEAAGSPPDPAATIASRQFIGLLVLAALVGVVASLVAWGFLELVFHMQGWVYTDLPDALGFDSTPLWWSAPVLALAGVIVAFAIVRLPGTGGHVPADGLNPAPTQPIELPGVLVAALASIGLGAVVGPEAPLIAMGGGLGLLAMRLVRRDAPPQVSEVMAASAILAALAFLFGSPIIAAVVLIEAAGLGGDRMRLVLLPGLLASGIGSLVWIGMGSWTGLSTDEISIAALKLPEFARPDLGDFGWTIPLAAAIAVGVSAIFRLGRLTVGIASARRFVVTPAVGLAVAGLAIAFSEIADKSVNEVLFSGETTLSPLVADSANWSLSALALLVACKGLAYGLSLGSFRGGPVFPAMFLGTAAGMMAAQLPGFELTPAIAVGIGAAAAAALRLPLSAAVLAVLLTVSAGPGATPLILVGVITAYMTSLALDAALEPEDAAGAQPAPAASAPG
jgi:H+/Cl- antiporter ClcA